MRKRGWAFDWRGALVGTLSGLGFLTACSSDDSSGTESEADSSASAHGGNGGSAGADEGGSAGADQGASSTSELPPAVQACEEVCDLYAVSCGMRCSNNCSIERLVYGEACDAQALRFYECAKTSTQTCAEDNTILATNGCQLEMTDYVTCYALEGVTCEREPALDSQCEDTPETPYSQRCVSDAVPADCVPALGAYYCCAME